MHIHLIFFRNCKTLVLKYFSFLFPTRHRNTSTHGGDDFTAITHTHTHTHTHTVKGDHKSTLNITAPLWSVTKCFSAASTWRNPKFTNNPTAREITALVCDWQRRDRAPREKHMVHIMRLAGELMMVKTICDQGGILGGFRDGDCRIHAGVNHCSRPVSLTHWTLHH